MFVNARAIIERDSSSGIEIVLQTRYKPDEGKKSIELPGGRVEEFESLVAALKREVQEETGLTLTRVQGADAKVISQTQGTEVECVQPFAVYQTMKGPVDSMGIYFRCQAEGNLLYIGDDTMYPQWVSIKQIAAWVKLDSGKFSWIDHAGLLFYLKYRGLA